MANNRDEVHMTLDKAKEHLSLIDALPLNPNNTR